MKKRSFLAALSLSVGALVGVSVGASAQSTPLHERTTTYRYDGVGRLVGEIAPDPDGDGPLKRPATRTIYDPNGLVLRVETGTLDAFTGSVPNNWTGFTILQTVRNSYDTLGQLVKTEVLGDDGEVISVVQTTYDRVGRPGCTAVRMNPLRFGNLPASACDMDTQEGEFGPDRITRNTYDTAGQLLQVRKAVGTDVEIADVTYSYTLNGQINQVVDANGNRAQMVYDGFDRQTEWRFPSKNRPANFNDATPATAIASAGAVSTDDKEVYTYDNNGNRETLRKRDGSLIEYDYDALNRMTRKTIPDDPNRLDPTHTRDVFYDYDLLDRPLRTRFDCIDGPGQRNIYDGFGRVTDIEDNTIGALRTLSYQYDDNGNRTRITHHDGYDWNFTYDVLDRLDQIKQGTGWISGQGELLIDYNFTDRGLPNDAWRGHTAPHQHWRYDNIGRMDEIILDGPVDAYDIHWTYTRNPASQILSETESNDIYSWDGHDNASFAYTTNGLNQYTGAGADSFTYDKNGNLTSEMGPNGDVTYLYDVENRLVKATRSSSTTELFYDPLGRLFKIADSQYGTTHFLYDGNALVAEIGTSGQVLRRYVHGSNLEADDPLVWYEGQDGAETSRRFVYPDPRGSIILVSDHQGDAVAVNSYDEYGIPDKDSGNDIATKGRFRYTGQAWLPELGMYYYKARIYSPTLGRFLQTDPIGYEDQFNIYAYVGNDPINGIDPTGLRETPAQIRLKQAEANYQREIRRLRETIDDRRKSGRGYGSLFRFSPLALTFALSGSTDRTRKFVYATYTKINQENGKRYTGMTHISVPNGVSDSAAAELAIARRDASHHMTEDGFGPAVLDRFSRNRAAIRGREQQRIDFFGGAQSDGGSSGNGIRAVDKGTYPAYRAEATRVFGPLPMRYGWRTSGQ